MRMLLTPYLQRDLGVVLLRPVVSCCIISAASAGY